MVNFVTPAVCTIHTKYKTILPRIDIKETHLISSIVCPEIDHLLSAIDHLHLFGPRVIYTNVQRINDDSLKISAFDINPWSIGSMADESIGPRVPKLNIHHHRDAAIGTQRDIDTCIHTVVS